MIEQGRFTIIQGASYRRSKEEVTIELKKKKHYKWKERWASLLVSQATLKEQEINSRHPDPHAKSNP